MNAPALRISAAFAFVLLIAAIFLRKPDDVAHQQVLRRLAYWCGNATRD